MWRTRRAFPPFVDMLYTDSSPPVFTSWKLCDRTYPFLYSAFMPLHWETCHPHAFAASDRSFPWDRTCCRLRTVVVRAPCSCSACACCLDSSSRWTTSFSRAWFIYAVARPGRFKRVASTPVVAASLSRLTRLRRPWCSRSCMRVVACHHYMRALSFYLAQITDQVPLPVHAAQPLRWLQACISSLASRSWHHYVCVFSWWVCMLRPV